MRLASLMMTLLIHLALCQPLVWSQEADSKEANSQSARSSDKVLAIALPLKGRRPNWWISYIRPERTFSDRIEIVKKENENWELDRNHNVWFPKGMKLKSSDDATYIEVDGRKLDVSKPLADFRSEFFTARLTSAASDEWSIVAVCQEYPSTTTVYVSSRDSSFEYGVKSFVTATVMGRHRQLIHVEIADNCAIVYVANYFGASVEVVNLEKKTSMFKCDLQYEPSEQLIRK